MPEENSMHENTGHFCSDMPDKNNQWEYNNADCEGPIYPGKYNTWIVFGRDRPAGPGRPDVDKVTQLNGYGPKGYEKAGCINIVAGRFSKFNSTDPEYIDTSVVLKDGTSPKKKINNSFIHDASFIYISQKADIDEYLNIAKGNYPDQKGISAIAIKSDDVRIVGRNSIKLVTYVHNEKLSTGISRYSKAGVQLIGANKISDLNNNDMQPIPKGNNLEAALSELADHVFSLSGILEAFANVQSDFNGKVSSHLHISTFFGINSSPSPEIIPAGKITALQVFNKVFTQCKFLTMNFMEYKMKFLSSTSATYINSKYHKLN